MTTESLQNPDDTIVHIARKHRLKQRLGQISTGKRFDRNVTAPLTRLEKKPVRANDLLTTVVTLLHTNETGVALTDERSIKISKYVAAMTSKVLAELLDPNKRFPSGLEISSMSPSEGDEYPLPQLESQVAEPEVVNSDGTPPYDFQASMHSRYTTQDA